jgi:heme-degrading monooxygenase HmoA
MIIQIIKLKSALSEEELLKTAKDREPQFKAIPGLIQKYYVKMKEEGQYGGVYIWDSKESLQAYRSSELASSIPQAYQLIEAPDIEVLDVMFQLRQ